MEPRLVTQNGSALLESRKETEWLRTDAVVVLDDWV